MDNEQNIAETTEPSTLYRHLETTRRPIVAVAIAICLLLTVIGWLYGAPTGYLLVAGLALAMAVAAFVAGRQSGCRIDTRTIRCFAGKWEKSIPVSTVSGYRLSQWSDGAPWIHLRLRDEAEWLVPAYCFGCHREFTAALERLGIERIDAQPRG